ncbi:MAG: hypothetical protein ACRDIU_00740, partial [Actinomycetota bacterium]
MKGPAGAFALVSLQVLAGTFFFLTIALVRYPFLNRGYFRSTAWVMWPLTLAVGLEAPDAFRATTITAAALMASFLAAVYTQRPLLEWLSSAAASCVGVVLVYRAGGAGTGGLQALSGLILMGAVTHAMVLGHWYLNQARLPINPLMEQTAALGASLALSLTTGVALRGDLVDARVPGAILAVSGSAYWWTWLLMVAGTAILAAMVWATVRV